MQETPTQRRRRIKHENQSIGRNAKLARRSVANFLRRATKAMKENV